MIEERALELWATYLCAQMGEADITCTKRVLEFTYAFGTPIPEEWLLKSFRSFFCNPPSVSECRGALCRMKLLPRL